MQGMTALGKTLQSLSSSLQVHFLAAGTAIAAEAAVGALRQANGEILFSEGGDQAAQRSCSYPTMEYITTRVNRTSPTVIEGRIYYEDIEANEEFWNRYSVYFEE